MDFFIKNWKKIALLLLLAVAVIVSRISGVTDYLTFDAVKEHRSALKEFVSNNYGLSVIIFLSLFLSTAFFLPGAIALMIVAGFLFGLFLSSRYLIGNWIQERFALQLGSFNREIQCHGQNYLLFLRIVPLFPFFAVNYLCGITTIPLGKFVWTTALGLLPASVLYVYTGRKLGELVRMQDLFSAELVATFSALGLFALLPVFMRLRRRLRKGNEGQQERPPCER
ncbi:MAG: associated Golgi protein-like protein [Deltaproteobacteria bacterium]|nr:associated Golgi protein-like protein [Deltaproteobacteria bacterium]